MVARTMAAKAFKHLAKSQSVLVRLRNRVMGTSVHSDTMARSLWMCRSALIYAIIAITTEFEHVDQNGRRSDLRDM